MGDLQNPRLIYLKGWLFLLGGGMAAGLILLEHPSLKLGLLMTVAIWCFARFYYFAFYVIQHYVDPAYRVAGLWDFVKYLFRRKTGGSLYPYVNSSNAPAGGVETAACNTTGVMPRELQSLPPLVSIQLPLRVRYPEADPMGYLHHSVYLQYFEMGRIELLRSIGHSYAELEAAGVFFVVTRAEVKYRAPARFDDELNLTVRLVREGPVRLDHTYELRKGDVLVAEANTTIACVGRDGQPRAMPEEMRSSR